MSGAAKEAPPSAAETAQRVARWLDDQRLVSESRHALVSALRDAVLAQAPGVTEAVKYGGILFSAGGSAFCGVFAYTAHVSLEFGQGATMTDPAGVLEGAGKGRRHIKFRQMDDLKRCDLSAYLQQAITLSK